MGHSLYLLALLVLSPYIAVAIGAVWVIVRISRQTAPLMVRLPLSVLWVGFLFLLGWLLGFADTSPYHFLMDRLIDRDGFGAQYWNDPWQVVLSYIGVAVPILPIVLGTVMTWVGVRRRAQLKSAPR